jgi:hypothetical protein
VKRNDASPHWLRGDDQRRAELGTKTVASLGVMSPETNSAGLGYRCADSVEDFLPQEKQSRGTN